MTSPYRLEAPSPGMVLTHHTALRPGQRIWHKTAREVTIFVGTEDRDEYADGYGPLLCCHTTHPRTMSIGMNEKLWATPGPTPADKLAEALAAQPPATGGLCR